MANSYATTTTNLGMSVPTTGCPDYEATNAVGLLTAAVNKLDNVVLNLEVKTAAAAITSTIGKVILKAGSAAAITLPLPIAGQPSAGGQDGQEMTVIAADAYAYTVTTPANGINGTKHIATWAAAVGNSVKLVAYNGVWLTDDPPNGVTLS